MSSRRRNKKYKNSRQAVPTHPWRRSREEAREARQNEDDQLSPSLFCLRLRSSGTCFTRLRPLFLDLSLILKTCSDMRGQRRRNTLRTTSQAQEVFGPFLARCTSSRVSVHDQLDASADQLEAREVHHVYLIDGAPQLQNRSENF